MLTIHQEPTDNEGRVIIHDTTDRFAEAERKARKAQAMRVEAAAPTVADSKRLLDNLRANGWQLDGYDLRVMESHIENVSSAYAPIEVGSNIGNLLFEAAQAIKRERAMRKLAQQRQADEQRGRITSITAAAHDLEQAHAKMDEAESIDVDRSLLPNAKLVTITCEDAHAMGSAELKTAIMRESNSASAEESGAHEADHDAGVLERFGGQQGKRLAKELRAVARNRRNRAAAHRANISTAQAELDGRAKAEQAAEEAHEAIVQTTADVSSLLQRVAELEAQMADTDKE